jgi:catechol 2,3-dioxygenase-like lactoylglutathione lyase family enzyme
VGEEEVRVEGLHHLAIQVVDLEVSFAFYAVLLGLPEVRRQPHSIWLQAGPVLLMLERCEGSETADRDDEEASFSSRHPGLHLVALRIEAVKRDAWRSRLREAGVVVEKETSFTLYVRDPDGVRVGLSHYPDPNPAPVA